MASSSTICASPRLLVGAPVAPHGRPRGITELGIAVLSGACSPAGLHRRPWLSRLRRALERDAFELHFQPIASLADGRIAHYEALLRLTDRGEHRPIAPGRFLPAAERYGLICAIDRMVLEKVVPLLAETRADACTGEYAVPVAVNISGLSLSERGMLDFLRELLLRHGVPPSALVIEVTETASIYNMERARAFCYGAAEIGCAIALDDFGTGYGSLHTLKQLPFHYLKIDGAFIRELCASAEDELVVRAVVALARGMGASTIAEFVADAHTLALLRELGVDYAQGFAVGRPQPLRAARAGLMGAAML
jgi:EAL domain-containing protein (putative c-di-GMP-specific phosphodiesterase class I)